MASRVDSLQDIFGPSEPSGAEAVETAPGVASSSATTTNLDEFDDIFASSTDDAPAPAAPSRDDAVAHDLKTKDTTTTPVTASSGTTDVSPSTDDFEDIFGNAPPATAEGLLSSSKEQTGGKSDPAGGTTSDATNGEATQPARSSDTKAVGTAGPGPSPAPVAGGGSSAGGDDSEFLNFLYDDDKKGKATAVAVTPQADAEQAASLSPAGTTTTTTSTTGAGSAAAAAAAETGSALRSNPTDASSPPTEKKTPSLPSEGPAGASGNSSPSSHLDSVPLGSPLAEDSKNAPADTTAAAAVAAAAERLEEAVKEGKLDSPSPSPAMPPPPPPPPPSSEMCFVRKEKVEVLPPLPEDPASALRELALATAEPGAEGAGAAASMASREGGPGGRGPAAAASDVGYVRRLCAATGGFLPPDLRAVVWGLLLGLGKRPE
ncbi:unnamed protein product, partial [Laminaria digitata]